jgi:hypothetical protein
MKYNQNPPMKSKNPSNPRLVLLTCAATVLLAAARCEADVLLQYRMGVVTAQIQDAVNTAAGGAITTGTVGTFNINSSPAFASSSGTPSMLIAGGTGSTNLTEALANSSWFTFGLTVGSSVADIDLTSLTFYATRAGTSIDRGFALYVTTPTTTDQQVQGATLVPTQSTTAPDFFNIDLSSFGSLQNLSAGQVVTFKIPVFTPLTSATIRIDDITVNGLVTPVPEPATVSLIGLGALVLFGVCRRRNAQK